MNKIGILVAASFIAVSAAAPAFAQGYAKEQKNIYRGQLGDASKFHQAPRQLQILDDGPILTDLRRPPTAPNTYTFNLNPLPAQAGNNYVYSDGNPAGGNASGFRSHPVNLAGLAPASEMHQSNIGSRPAVDTGHLPQGINTGIHGPTGDAAMGGRSSAAVSGRVNPGPQALSAQSQTVKVYKSYNNPLGGGSFGTSKSATEVTGVLRTPVRKSPLLNKILPNNQ